MLLMMMSLLRHLLLLILCVDRLDPVKLYTFKIKNRVKGGRREKLRSVNSRLGPVSSQFEPFGRSALKFFWL